MAQKKLHLVTGYAGEEHIHSADQGSFNASFFGAGEYVMEAGNQFEASIMDNNTVRILDGDALMKGRHLRIEPNTYADVTITTGTAGVNRNDLIVFQYSKDTSTDIETPEIVVIKGTETEGTATDPAYTDGDILAGATFNQMPMYRVKVEGVVLVAVEPLFEVIPTYKKLAEEAKKEFKTSCENHLNSLNILDTKEEIEANTLENQLAGALAVKELIASLFTAEEIRKIVGSYYDKDTDGKYLLSSENEWVFVGTAGLKELPLYVNGNQANFVGYIGNLQGLTSSPVLPTLNIGETLKITANCYASSAISDKYDLTRFSKLKFHHASITANNSSNKITVFITDVKQDKMIPVTSKILAEGGNKNVVGEIELDITNLSGEYYIGFDLLNNAGGVSTEISNMKLS